MVAKGFSIYLLGTDNGPLKMDSSYKLSPGEPVCSILHSSIHNYFYITSIPNSFNIVICLSYRYHRYLFKNVYIIGYNCICNRFFHWIKRQLDKKMKIQVIITVSQEYRKIPEYYSNESLQIDNVVV